MVAGNRGAGPGGILPLHLGGQRVAEALRQTTTVIVTHDLEEAFELADVICLMDQGELQQFDSPRNLLAKPANDFVREFLGSQQLQLALQVLNVADLKTPAQATETISSTAIAFADQTRLKEVEAQLLAHAQPVIGQGENGQYFDLTDLHRTAVDFLRQNHS